MWPDSTPRAATIILKHPGALRKMLLPGTAKGLGEAYMRDDYDVEGDIEQAVELAIALEKRPRGWLKALTNYYNLRRLPITSGASADTGKAMGERMGGRHSASRDKEVVSFHYDISNDFYRLWLDREMVYSCGYFETPDKTLDESQAAKLRFLCRKLP